MSVLFTWHNDKVKSVADIREPLSSSFRSSLFTNKYFNTINRHVKFSHDVFDSAVAAVAAADGVMMVGTGEEVSLQAGRIEIGGGWSGRFAWGHAFQPNFITQIS